jgi:hypothetical protein
MKTAADDRRACVESCSGRRSWKHFAFRKFATVAELVEALRGFRLRYNEQWLIERHGYRKPAQVRFGFAGSTSAIA